MLTVLPEQFIRHQGIGTIDCGCERLQSNLSHCSQAYQIGKVTGADLNDSPNIGMLSKSNAMLWRALLNYGENYEPSPIDGLSLCGNWNGDAFRKFVRCDGIRIIGMG